MLFGFRGLLAAFDAIASQLAALTASQVELAKIQQAMGPALDRLNALELSRHRFEAEMEGILLKADGKLKAASNAEARERQLKKSYERNLLDPLDTDGQEGTEERAEFLPVHAAPGEAQGMPPLHLDVAPNGKALAVRAKFGLT